MADQPVPSEVLTIRLPRAIVRRLAQEARRQRRTRSEVARAILTSGLSDATVDPKAEAARQSRLVSERVSEREAINFSLDSADLRGWE